MKDNDFIQWKGICFVKVLQITSHYNQGGAARIAACIHRQLLSDGIESKVVYGRGRETSDSGVVKFENNFEIYLSAFLSRFVGINGWWNFIGTRRLIKILEMFQPDVIHIHALHGYYVNFPMLWRYINKHQIPIVWTFHDCHAFVGNCGYFFECKRWKNGCNMCPHLKEYPTSQWFDFTGWMWKKKKNMFTQEERKIIVSPSEWMTKLAKQSFFNKYPCITIRNGIDTENIFYPRDKGAMRCKYGYKEEDKLVLGIAVGYKDPRKGVKYIIQMAQDLQNEAIVILIGWDETCNDKLHGVHNLITLSATANTEMLAEYYSMVDVFVLPSLAENYATTNLEAMACGTPVVGFAVGGTPEQLAGGRGIAVEPENQEKFTEAVKKILDNPELVMNREMLAKEIHCENSLEKMSLQYQEIYERLCNDSICVHGHI